MTRFLKFLFISLTALFNINHTDRLVLANNYKYEAMSMLLLQLLIYLQLIFIQKNTKVYM